ncbi:hypothetical protein AN958_10708 [Leucoagaricus sp. SymC.cos]|nr:hypothetical protein AN958_10708 [Leucoagaricus sp. SymC.cos]
MPTNQLLDPQVREPPDVVGDDDMELDIDSTNGEKIYYVAGACSNPGSEEARAGSGIVVDEPSLESHSLGLRVPGNQTIQAAELCLEHANKYERIKIISQTRQAIEAVTVKFKKWEDLGWVETPYRDLTKKIITLIRSRKAPTRFHWLNKPTQREGAHIERAKSYARQGREKRQQDEEGTSLKGPYHPDGAKLQAVTQASVYKHLIETRKSAETETSKQNITKIKTNVKSRWNFTPTTAHIWHSLKRNKNILKKHREFLYKGIKGTHYIGKKWLHTDKEELKERATCRTCNVEESLEHILTKCRAPGQSLIWETARKIWNERYDEWQKPTLGEILGVTTISQKDGEGNKDDGKTRFHQILITECAHLTWRLRCERVIGNNNDPQRHTDAAILSTLKYRLNHRFRMDCILTSTRKFEKKALREDIVRDTWSGILDKEEKDDLPRSWLKRPGVLVGIRFFRAGAPHT